MRICLTPLIPILTKSIQGNRQEIKQLKIEDDGLKSEVDSLKSELSAIKIHLGLN